MTSQPNEAPTPDDFEFRALEEAKNYRAALLEEFSEFLAGDVLEVGAGVGQFSTLLSGLTAIRKILAVEPESRFFANFRAAAPQIEVVHGTVDATDPESAWDAVVCINVLEHIEADVTELAKYRERLAPRKGHLCLFVPARQEIYAPLDKDFGHFRRYSRKELRGKLERGGFSIRRLRYYNWIGYFAWWYNFCLLKRRHFDIQSVIIFDRMIFPAMHFLERRLLSPPFGQSLLAVAQAL